MGAATAVPTEVDKLGKLFEAAGHEIRIVGGWVRDTLQGVRPKDLDLATTATPEQVIALCEQHGLRHIETGLHHGTVSIALKPDRPKVTSSEGPATPVVAPVYEVTTLRRDVLTDGRHAEVEWTTDWHMDAARRDFTVNAMMIGMDGRLYDFFNGAGHLKDRRIVFVGDAEARIREDYLRILRWFRFRSRIGDRTNDRETLSVLRKTADGLQQISVERIWSEVSRILAGDVTMLAPVLMDMIETKVMHHIGLPDLFGYDVVRGVLAREVSANPLTVLAAMSMAPMEKLWKMSTDEARLLVVLRKHWNQLRGLPDEYPDLAYFQDLALKRNVGYDRALEVCRMFGPSETLAEFSKWTMPVFPVTGEDLAALGIGEGIECGKVLRDLRKKWRLSVFSLSKNDLLAEAVL